MEKIFWWLFRRKYELIYHGKSSNSDKNIKKIPKLKEDIPIINSQDMQRFVCKKVESTKINGDSIDKWTFGIVSNGERRDWVDSCIESIRKQHIPECEIIICGTYFGDECDDLRLFSA